jgi:hypothetical protein
VPPQQRSSQPHVVIRVHARPYRLPADTFAQWAVRSVAGSIATATGVPHSEVVGAVIAAYINALDERIAELAA